MRALVLRGFGDAAVEDVPDPVPGPGEVVIDVACVQPSVTECMLLAGEPIAMHTVLAERLAAGPTRFGGHEFAGVITALGPGVVPRPPSPRTPPSRIPPSRTPASVSPALGAPAPGAPSAGTSSAGYPSQLDLATRTPLVAAFPTSAPAGGRPDSGLAVGDRVTAVETATCGQCAACRRARPDACRSPEVLGFTGPGAFAERVVVAARTVVRVPDGVPAAHAAAVQPLAGAIHGHAIAAVKPGDTVLVIGAGVMGVLHTQVARHGNAGLIIVTGRSAAKRALAKRAGADLVLDATADDIVAHVMDATDGIGADVVFECAGEFEQAVRCARRGGTVVMVSVLSDHAPAPLARLRERSVSLLHPRSGAGGYAPGSTVFEHALRLVQRGDVDLQGLISHRLAGVEALPEALEITRYKGRYSALGPAQVDLFDWNRA
ncbi:zinc-binding dehydrogenase [Dactylosporangium vinaceum]|uniref:Zinc-binding dehydrogenase n=1 Tax=Dactylosporangium vinaceum TaxID=53362 RepID=A0ABV5MRM9_9ACTN|nr:zinc-binding dehydrogenase [Dactylosporangium vinaceum]UAC00412.1 zinc-binding dehydrogenase [Dactylosporangium vinaceum]